MDVGECAAEEGVDSPSAAADGDRRSRASASIAAATFGSFACSAA
ncbi:Uncharacterised protein [Mycobacteroides abscessus subsp. abscessus]|nr:Uncharacterised protein [Mycobacteroides abscessus subsp. abscessus]